MKKGNHTLLKQRAIAMAYQPEQQRDNITILKIVEFNLGDEIYGIESAFVREVFTLTDFTRLPGVPSFILGIVNLRGQILSLVDLKKFFNLPEKGLGELNKVIILRDEQMEFGILADEVNGTKEIYTEEILPVPQTVTGIGANFLKGVTKNRLILLSAEDLLSDKNLVIHEEVTHY